MRGKLIGIVLMMMLLCSGVSVYGDSNLKITLDGKDASNLGVPSLVNDRTMLPARSILESFGFKLEWDPVNQMVSAKKDDYSVEMQINSSKAFVNGEEQFLDQPATLIEGRTYIPVRFFSEAVGAEIAYNADTKTVNIDTSALQKTVTVYDLAFQNALEKKYNTAELTVGTLLYTTSLDMISQGIFSLEGIDGFKNLKSLNVSKNSISDLAPLLKLDFLENLNASNNSIENFDVLKKLPNLKVLNLQNNKINSFESLRSITWIEDLKITGNATQDYKPLYYNLSTYKSLDVDPVRIEQPDFDTRILSTYKSFETPIIKGISWISAKTIGASSFKNDGMMNLIKSQGSTLNNSLSTVYEVLQLLQNGTNWVDSHENEKKTSGNGGEYQWINQPEPVVSIESEKVSNHGLACLSTWMLYRDYVENGTIMAVSNDGNVESYSYVRQDRREEYKHLDLTGTEVTDYRYIPEYFVFSPADYSIRSGAVPETGLLDDYLNKGTAVGGVLKVESLQAFSDYIQSKDANIVCINSIRMDGVASPFVAYSVSVKGTTRVFLPVECKDVTSTLYKADGVSVLFETVTK